MAWVDALEDAAVEGVVTSVALLPQPAATTGNPAYPVAVGLSAVSADLRPGMSVRAVLR